MATIRIEEPADFAAVREVNTRAFGRENEAKLVEALRQSEGAVSLVAVEEDQVVGHILFSPVSLQSEAGSEQVMALAPMAVLPKYQNRGIGSALVRRGLEACRDRGHRIVIVLGHAEYYPRFGFSPARPQGIEPPIPVSDQVWMALELQPGALGSVHGVVRYPPVFNEV